MKKTSFEEALHQITREDPRYDAHAYLFIREALDFTIKELAKPTEGPARHVSGKELLEGIRRYALAEYGPIAHRVLSHWGLGCTEDFGNMVFNLVDKGILGKTAEDSQEDFAGGYDFEQAFLAPFRPRKDPTSRGGSRVRRPAKAPSASGSD